MNFRLMLIILPDAFSYLVFRQQTVSHPFLRIYWRLYNIKKDVNVKKTVLRSYIQFSSLRVTFRKVINLAHPSLFVWECLIKITFHKQVKIEKGMSLASNFERHRVNQVTWFYILEILKFYKNPPFIRWQLRDTLLGGSSSKIMFPFLSSLAVA